jgi:hypothetical protein
VAKQLPVVGSILILNTSPEEAYPRTHFLEQERAPQINRSHGKVSFRRLHVASLRESTHGGQFREDLELNTKLSIFQSYLTTGHFFLLHILLTSHEIVRKGWAQDQAACL